ncbi:tRNA (N(6)-L-threonylcarbamoyladenosine(37)-C(2))-methylthiotransferase [Thermogymnomonas acidicola]|nr:tRNA (N(6)-L-threonylcarbamoyladenosine(37)-C(2))-methylthiotransferase [Thermogymnomonas acidicola]
MRIYVESYGCTLNRAETGLYVNRLLSEGAELVQRPEEADIGVIGTCVVIRHTEEKMLRRIEELSSKVRVKVTGCLPAVSAGQLEGGAVEVLKPREARSLYTGYLDDVEIREASIFEGIPINQGCTGSCSYCISRVSRGKLLSRPVEKIVKQVEMQLERGIREIRLTSLDTAAYGKDTGHRLPELVAAILRIPKDFRLRVGMMEPKNAGEIAEELFRTYSDPRVFRFLHLPVQSGDDRVLRDMNREYTVSDFERIVRMFRERFPDSTLSTDIICGYHSDDEESFENTVRLIERTEPEIINITRFSPRPFTKDFGSKTPPSNVMGRWSRALTELHREISARKMASLVGRTEAIIFAERGKQGTTVGRDSAYRPVVVPGEYPLYGEAQVEVVDSTETYLVGRVI